MFDRVIKDVHKGEVGHLRRMLEADGYSVEVERQDDDLFTLRGRANSIFDIMPPDPWPKPRG